MDIGREVGSADRAGLRQTLAAWPPWGKVAAVIVCAFVVYLLVTPLVALVVTSLNASTTGLDFRAGFSLGNYHQALGQAGAVDVLLNSVVYSLGTVVLSLAMTVVLAYLLERCDLPAVSFLRMLILGPLGVPPIVLAIGWVLLGNGRNGLLSFGGRLDVQSLPGMIFVTSIVMVPSMYLMLSSQFLQLDPALEDAAAASGVGFLQRTRRVTLALLKPALAAAGLFFLVISLEAFDVAAVIGLPRNIYVFSTVIYVSVYASAGPPEYGVAAAYGVVLVAISLLLIAWYRRVTSGPSSRFRVISGKGYRPTRIRLGSWKVPAVAFVIAVACVGSIAPLVILLWSSLLPFYAGFKQNLAAHWTLANYASLLSSAGLVSAVWHTLAIMAVAATVTVLIAAWAAWAVDRGRYPAARLILDGSFMLLGVPGVVVAIALLFVYLMLPKIGVPINLYGTIWIVVVAYITRFLAYTARLMDTAVRQIDVDMENAGYVSGVPAWAVLRRVVWPLLAPAMVRGWLWVAVHIVREVPIAVLLVATANETVAADLWQAWSTASTISRVSAFAVLLTVFSMAGTWILSRFSGAESDVVAGL